MPRKARVAPGGLVYHVLNRAAGKLTLFRREEDYAAFERVMLEAHRRCPLRVLSYCLMPNHWHFVAWPRRDGELTAFFRWLTHTHAMRWRVAHHSVGRGPLYQGRFKSFPVQRDEHLSTVCRYVERNALSGGLVRRAEAWRHGSLWTRDAAEAPLRAVLCDWPAGRPADWVRHVNQPLSRRELQRLAEGERRGRPFGGDEWVGRTVAKLGLQHTVRPPGRPRTAAKGEN